MKTFTKRYILQIRLILLTFDSIDKTIERGWTGPICLSEEQAEDIKREILVKDEEAAAPALPPCAQNTRH